MTNLEFRVVCWLCFRDCNVHCVSDICSTLLNAVDIILYAKSVNELQKMAELLIAELKFIGLRLNASKTKILHTEIEDELCDVDFAEIDDEFVRVLHTDNVHRYLGRHLSFSMDKRIDQEIRYRQQQAWTAFYKHKKIILNKHVSLQKRLQYFDLCVSPAILFALPTLPVSVTRLRALDVLQRKMLRRIVGWRRIEDESWRSTMQRMNERMQHGQTLYYCKPWSMAFAHAQWRYIAHIITGHPMMWSRRLCKQNFIGIDDPQCKYVPFRRPGRPRMRWDDHIHAFCKFMWPQLEGLPWFDALCQVDVYQYEDSFVTFLMRRPV